MSMKDAIFGTAAPSSHGGATYRDSIQAWLPVKNIIGGVVITKDNRFIKILEVLPIYETISALCTVGLTTGITSGLGLASCLILIIFMFFGRVGIMTISVGFMMANPAEDRITYAQTRVMIG